MTVKQLRIELVEQGLLPESEIPGRLPWMAYYLKKAEMVKMLSNGSKASNDLITGLRLRQKQHMTNARQARKDRKQRFGITALTPEERVQQVMSRFPSMSYLKVRPYPDGFESATGYSRGKHAIVFKTDDGEEVLLTKGEARIVTRLGVRVPATALKQQRSLAQIEADASRPKTKTARDLFA